MKTALLVFVLFVCAVSANGAIPNEPDYTLRWSGYYSVTTIDSFAIATTGNGLVVLQQVSHQLGYKAVDNIFLPTPPGEQKLFDSLLMVRNSANQIYVFNVAHLPEVRWLATLDIDIPFNDFVLTDSTLLVSRGFDGLWRYRLRDNSALYLDSDVTGIDYTALAVHADTLYALDEYNGVLYYRLPDAGRPQFLDYLFIPFEARSLLHTDSGLVIALADTALLLANTGPTGPHVSSTIGLLITPTRLFVSGTRIIVADTLNSYFEAIDLATGVHAYLPTDQTPVGGVFGSVAVFDTLSYLLYPSRSGGLVMYSIDAIFNPPAYPVAAAGRYGPITGLAISHHKLFFGGLTNPLDIYSLAPDGRPAFLQTLYGGLTRISGIDRSGDSLFVLYPQLRRALTLQITPDSILYRGGLFLDTLRFHSIRFLPEKRDTLRLFFAVGDDLLNLYTVSDSGEITTAGSIQTIGATRDVELVDTILAVATGKGVWLYRLYNDFSFEYRSIYQANEGVYAICPYGGRLLVFEGKNMRILDISNPVEPVVDTTIELPVQVYSTTVDEDFLYAVGRSGLMVFQLGGNVPQLIDYGGRQGFFVTAEHGLVAISDSNAIHIFDLRNIVTDVAESHTDRPQEYSLGQNYPNPFNPSTTIAFSLPHYSEVSVTIYNLLGQEVTTLCDQKMAPGTHYLTWNGVDRSGTPVATGVYLYRIVTDQWSASKKMLFLK